uniref:RNA-directed DNA polymerase n=1 Tax=Tetranychus urticae TaxID=32264 RepID=A0A158P4N7_TETUR
MAQPNVTSNEETRTNNLVPPLTTANVTFPNVPVNINFFSGDDDENVIDWFDSFEFAAAALGWSKTDMFNVLPAYLQGTARRWYYAITSPIPNVANVPDTQNGMVAPSQNSPQDYHDLKTRMIADLCPADYRSYLSQELYKSKQKIGQSAIAFIYEIHELCRRIHEQTREVFIISMIKEKLLPQIKYGIALQNPKTLHELVEAARLAERAMHSCSTPFDAPSKEVTQLQTQVQQMKEKLESLKRCNICKRLGHTEERCYFAKKPENEISQNNYGNRNQGLNNYQTTSYNPNMAQYNQDYQRVISQANQNYQTAARNFIPGNPGVSNQTFAKRTFPRNNADPDNWRNRPSISIKEPEVKMDPPKGSEYKSKTKERSPSPKRRGRPPSKDRGRGRGRGKAPQVRITTYRDDKSEEEVDSDYCIESDEATFVNPVVHLLNQNLIQQFVKVNGCKVDSMLDTGSEISLITKDLVHELNLNVSKYKGPTPFAANNKPLPILGKVKVQLKITDGRKIAIIDTKMQVVNNLPRKFKVLIGQDLLTRAQVNIDCANRKIKIGRVEPVVEIVTTEEESSDSEPIVDTSTESEDLNDLLNDLNDFVSSDVDQLPELTEDVELEIEPITTFVDKSKIPELELNIEKDVPGGVEQALYQLCNNYREVFAVTPQELGRTNLFMHRIETGHHAPISQSPYSQSAQKREITKQIINELLRDGIIVDSFSPWCSPVVLVSKKTGDWRMCVDYRKLNAITVKDSYPIPNINVSLDALQGSEYFSLLDLRSGYHQVELAPEDRQKSAFVTSFGMYEYVTMPFGLCNAPATFQRLMNCCLGGLKYKCCLVYIEDIIVFSKTIKEHLERLEAVFDSLRRAGLTLKPDKCFFFKKKILYLGHIISAAGQEPDPEKIRAVKNFPVPVTLKDIRAFVALCSYYRKFIKDFAKIAQPLTQLTKKEVPFIWGPTQIEAFEYLKNCLVKAPVLAHYNHMLETQLRTDASDIGLGAILLQKHENKWKPVAFASRQIRGAEINYLLVMMVNSRRLR